MMKTWEYSKKRINGLQFLCIDNKEMDQFLYENLKRMF